MKLHDMKLVLVLSLAITVGGCATAPSPGPAANTDLDKAIQLPATFENIWFRTEKVRFGLAYEATGTLIVSKDAIVFNHADGAITVAAETVQRVTEGRLAPDMMNIWLGVHYVEAGTARLAAFEGSPFSASPSNSHLYAAMRAMLLPGKSTATFFLEQDTLFQLIGLDRTEDKDCSRRRVVNREIVTADAKESLEHWTLDRCGTLVRYRIRYTPSPDGGTTILWTPGEVVGKAR
jgi:hypothetical protein